MSSLHTSYHLSLSCSSLFSFKSMLSVFVTCITADHCQGSPKCGIVGGDKTEVEGEIGASREDPGACSPGKILEIYNT